MKLTFFGTGTSMGIPLINCGCPVCTSDDTRDTRLRCGARLEVNGHSLLIDASSDLRHQALRYGLPTIDGIFVTHPHADHVFGLDDTRIFSLREDRPIHLYAADYTLKNIRRLFWYAFEGPRDERMVKPVFRLHPLADRQELFDTEITCIHATHGDMPVTGFRFGPLTYITDFNHIEPAEKEKVRGSQVLVLGALRHSPSASHLTVKQALDLVHDLKPSQTWLTHFSHEIRHRELEEQLPEHVHAAYDGLEIEI